MMHRILWPLLLAAARSMCTRCSVTCACLPATPAWLCTSATAREGEATSTIVLGEAHPRESIRQAAAAQQSRAAHVHGEILFFFLLNDLR